MCPPRASLALRVRVRVQPETAAAQLRAANINVLAVGVGSAAATQAAVAELESMASAPSDGHVSSVASFGQLEGAVNRLRVQTCLAPALLEVGEGVTHVLEACQAKYFRPRCQPQGNTTIRVETSSGNVSVRLGGMLLVVCPVCA